MQNQDCALHSAECKCISWRPIIAGALVAIGLSFLLHLFSVAIGLTAYTADIQWVENLAFGCLIATAFGGIVVMFASGWIAGHLGKSYCTKRHLGALYGFLTWVVSLIALMFIVDNILHYVIVYSHSISNITGMPTTPAAMQNDKTANSVVLSSYIVFVLFFLGAFAASFGGHLGMRYVCKDEM